MYAANAHANACYTQTSDYDSSCPMKHDQHAQASRPASIRLKMRNTNMPFDVIRRKNDVS